MRYLFSFTPYSPGERNILTSHPTIGSGVNHFRKELSLNIGRQRQRADFPDWQSEYPALLPPASDCSAGLSDHGAGREYSGDGAVNSATTGQHTQERADMWHRGQTRAS
jgi:hypothetical protein